MTIRSKNLIAGLLALSFNLAGCEQGSTSNAVDPITAAELAQRGPNHTTPIDTKARGAQQAEGEGPGRILVSPEPDTEEEVEILVSPEPDAGEDEVLVSPEPIDEDDDGGDREPPTDEKSDQ